MRVLHRPSSTWTTTGPYWNFPFPCWNVDPAKDTCPGTVHADQHALAISGSTLYTADDGGVYSHPLRDVGVVKWRDLNATLTTLIQGQNPPDIAILPNPGKMQQLASQGNLVSLDNFLDVSTIQSQYAKGWIDLGSYQGKLYAGP